MVAEDKRRIHEEVALHKARGIEGPVRKEDLEMDKRGNGPFFAEQAMMMADPNKKENAVRAMALRVEGVLGVNGTRVAGRDIRNIGDITQLEMDVEGTTVSIPNAEKTDYNKLVALRHDVVDGVAVATVVTLSANEEMTQLIKGGDAAAIETGLTVPVCLKGIGKVVIDSAITNKVLRAKLKFLQLQENAGTLVETRLLQVADAIQDLIENEQTDEPEATMIQAYLSGLVGGIEEDRNIEISERQVVQEERERATEEWQERQERAFNAQQRLTERNLMLGEEAEKTTYLGWLAVIAGKSGQTGLPSAVWALQAPDYFRGSGAEWNDFLDRVTTWSNKVMSRKVEFANARDVGKAYFSESFPKISERDFAEALADRRTNLEGTLRYIAKDLYVEAVTQDDGTIRAITDREVEDGVHGLFVMKYSVGGVDAEAQEGAEVMAGKDEGGRRAYLMRVADVLVNRGVTKDHDYAVMMASLGLDLLELGNGIDGTDHMRKCNFAVEAVRTKSRPGFKFGSKTAGGEVFAGAWSAYYQEVFADEIEREVGVARRAAGAGWSGEKEVKKRNEVLTRMAFENGLIPQVLCGSILDTKVKVARGGDVNGEMILGRALQGGVNLAMNKESTEDVLFPVKKWFENASEFWDFICGDKKLDFKGGILEVDSVLRDFAKGLNNAYIFLRDKGLVNEDKLIGAMGGAAGLVPSVPMILNIPISVSSGTTYSFLVGTMLEHMPGLTSSEVEEVKTRLAVDKPIANKLSSWWESSKDGRLSKKQRASWRRRLQDKSASGYERAYRNFGEK